MTVYSEIYHQKAKRLWQAGKCCKEIAGILGVKCPKTISKWRKKEGWEDVYKGNNLKLVRRVIELLDEKISQGELKSSIADLNRMVRLKKDLENRHERIKHGGKSDQAMSDEQLNKEIEKTAKRIASLEREKAKGKKG